MSKKSKWIAHILRNIACFADLDWQHREWVLGEYNPYASFVESMCMLNDDAYFEEILDHYADQFNFSPLQFQSLSEFRKALNDFGDDPTTSIYEEEMIKDPKWHEVVKKAQKVIEVFKDYTVIDDTEFTIKI